MSKAKMSGVKISVAKIQVAKMQVAKMSEAKMSVAKMSVAQTSVAQMLEAKMLVAKMSVAKMSLAKASQPRHQQPRCHSQDVPGNAPEIFLIEVVLTFSPVPEKKPTNLSSQNQLTLPSLFIIPFQTLLWCLDQVIGAVLHKIMKT